MMKNLKFITITFMVFILQSCNSASKEEYKLLEKKYNSLLFENKELKREIEELKLEPEKLFSEGLNFLSSKNYKVAELKFKELIEKHPSAPQTEEANMHLKIIKIELEKLQKLQEKENIHRAETIRKRLANATSKMRIEKDEIKGTSWYKDKNTTNYNNVNSFHVYMGKQVSGKPWLRFRIQYKGDDWLFIENYNIKTDTKTHTFYPKNRVERDNGSGDIWEWCDESMNGTTYSMLQDVINSKSVVLRCNGNQYYKDRKLSSREIAGIKNVFDAYEALGGDFNFN